MPPKISLITTCYNRAEYIAECIESVMNSQYSDFEYIIVDDNSTDNSWEIIRSLTEGDERVRSFRNVENLGDYPNRNRGLSFATGELVKFIDADDTIYPYSLHYLAHYMDEFPTASFALLVSPFQKHKPLPLLLPKFEAIHFHYCSYPIFYEGPTSSIFRREAMNKVGGFSGKRMIGDFEAWHELNLIGDCLILPKGSLTFWREHEAQEMEAHRNDLSFVIAQHKYSQRWLQAQSEHHPKLRLARDEAAITLKRWLFFVLRTRKFQGSRALLQHFNIKRGELFLWAFLYYLSRKR